MKSSATQRRWRAAGALLFLCLIGMAGTAGAVERVTLRLSWLHQFQFAGYYVAQQRGFYRDAGLDVDLQPGGVHGVNTIEAVLQGQAEFGVSNAGVSAARMNGKPVVALAAVLQDTSRVWLTPGTASHAPNLPALARGRVMWAGTPEDSTELMLPLARAGVKLAQLQSLPARFSPDAFARGEVDLYAAYLSNEVLELQRRGVAFHAIETGSLTQFYSEVLFTSASFAAAHPLLVSRFRAASLKGWEAAFDDIEGTARLIHEHYAPGTPVAVLVAEGLELRRLARRHDIEIGHMSMQRWRQIATQQQQLGLGRDLAAIDSLVFDSAVLQPQAWPDPMRLGLIGLVLALCATIWALWRAQLASQAEVATIRARQQEAIADELRYRFLMDVAPFPVLMFGIRDGEIVYANERALGWLGLMEGHANAQVQRWLPDAAPGSLVMQRLQASRILRDLELELPGQNGAPARWCLLTMRVVEYEGRPCAFAAATDITLRKSAEQELSLLSAQRGRLLDEAALLQARLRDASVRDPLTRLFNRRYLDATLSRELQRCNRDGRPLALLVVDADHFKRINDQHGHAAGDDVLRALAHALNTMHRGADVVCRFGGEEFVVVLPGSDASHAARRAEEVRLRIQALEVATDGGLVRITVSIGVAAIRAGEDRRSLFKRADAAVYAAKQQGRNRVVLAPESDAAGPP